MLKSRFRSTTAIMAASLAFAVCVTEARADLVVYVGYADNLRTNGFFPSPWVGGSNVVSQTPSPNSILFDSGAIRIDNTGTTAVTISNVTASNFNNGATFTLWNPLVIGPGQIGIFTQLDNNQIFDSSDQSNNGSPPGNIQASDPGSNGIGGCSSTAGAQASAGITSSCSSSEPVVSFSINGAPSVSLTDTGHILDTGNYDFVNNNVDGNESINWNLIGSEANRGGTSGVPEPSTWAMMLIGFVGLGFAGYRRAKKARATVAA